MRMVYIHYIGIPPRVVVRGGPGGHAPQTFLKYLVILCFVKRRPKQKYFCSRKIKHFGPPKFWAGYVSVPPRRKESWNVSRKLTCKITCTSNPKTKRNRKLQKSTTSLAKCLGMSKLATPDLS